MLAAQGDPGYRPASTCFTGSGDGILDTASQPPPWAMVATTTRLNDCLRIPRWCILF